MGDSFSYKIEEFIENGDGEYDGYGERTVGTGHYFIESAAPGNTSVRYIWEWTYTSDTEPSRTGSANYRFRFNPQTREYLWGFDLDQEVGSPAFVWFWIPGGLRLGDRLAILDQNFTVTSLDAVVWSNWAPYHAVELATDGSFHRNDDYGDFYATYTDRYYFDRESGFIIAERYTEHDSGTFEGEFASFDWKFNFDVTETSYPLAVDWGNVAGYYIALPGLVVAILAAIGYAVRWRARDVYLPDDSKLRVKRIRRMRDFTWPAGGTTRFFGPFMPGIVDKALAAGDRVGVALNRGALEGVAIYHKDVKVGSIFSVDKYVNEALRRFIGTKDFFSETRHQDSRGSGGDVYNIYETHRILVNRQLGPLPYDASAVRPMTEADLPRICEISKNVYKVRARKWYATLLEKGDVGLVALADGAVAGFAFATVADGWARLHTLTVDPRFRGRGLGKELMRARLSMAYFLDASAAMVEIAEWNLPSLRISTSMGFAPEGWMYVESARRRRKERTIVRR